MKHFFFFSANLIKTFQYSSLCSFYHLQKPNISKTFHSAVQHTTNIEIISYIFLNYANNNDSTIHPFTTQFSLLIFALASTATVKLWSCGLAPMMTLWSISSKINNHYPLSFEGVSEFLITRSTERIYGVEECT